MERGRKNRVFSIFLAVLAVLALAASIFYLQQLGAQESLEASNPVFFFLIELNVILLAILTFLIGRNLVRLIFDRKRKILGSAIRMRLVMAFVGLTLIPIALVFLLASGLLNTVMQGWFSTHVETAVEGAVEVSRIHFESLQEGLKTETLRLQKEFENRWHDRIDLEQIQSYLERQRSASDFFAIKLVDAKSILVEAQNAASMIENFKEPSPDPELVRNALNSRADVTSRRKEGGQFIEAYAPLRLAEKPLALITTRRINPELVEALGDVNSAYNQYQQLKFHKADLQSGYILILSMITASILFAAIWTGFYVARVIAVPIQQLAEGTKAVASGNYAVKIEASGGDELGLLVESFNQMTTDLRLSREEAERRRGFLETVLGNLAIGVIALDPKERITSVNSAASRLFALQSEMELKSKTLDQVFDSSVLPELQSLLNSLRSVATDSSTSSKSVECQVNVVSDARELKIVCTAGPILDSQGKRLGSLLLFDDITELAKAQSMAVWREVARRIAHEIKNPLTPIQLSAQRLERLLGQDMPEQAVKDSVQAILENVDSIKRLANEFSNFARMPTAELQPANLNVLISDVVASYAENHSDVVFQFIADNKMPEVRVDREQIRRVLINLIENAIDAVAREDSQIPDKIGRRIVLKSSYDRKRKVAIFEIADNGAGIPGSDKSRIFEPYFTTKKRGTGLGLAIVTSIISDHQGDINVYDNTPYGTKFIVELPLTPKDSTQRRLAGAEV